MKIPHPITGGRLRAGLLLPALLLTFMLPPMAQADSRADAYYRSAIEAHGRSDLREVFQLYARSAELGHPAGQYNVAMMYCNGESVNVDYQ